jgi:hypothetical protein
MAEEEGSGRHAVDYLQVFRDIPRDELRGVTKSHYGCPEVEQKVFIQISK